MRNDPGARTLVTVGVQARDKPDARSAMENDAIKVAYLLSNLTVFLLSAGTQVLAKPGG